MSLLYPRDCLAFHKSRSLSVAKSLADKSSAHISAQLKLFSNKTSKVAPEAAALKFYGLNHAVAAIGQRRAPHQKMTAFEQEIVETYYKEATHIGLRNFYYLLLITIRESRHLKYKHKMITAYGPQFGVDVMTYIGSVPDNAGEAMESLKNNPPPGTIGNLVSALQAVFHNGSWTGGYGGKAWGCIADCMASFVKGNTSLEQMTDTVFTLAHNNGSVYNKGALFHHFGERLIELLDVQASGQIPNCIVNSSNNAHHITTNLVDKEFLGFMQRISKEFPEFATPVDWFKVVALGGKKKYDSWMAAQVKNGIASPYEGQVEAKIGSKYHQIVSKPLPSKAEITGTDYDVPGTVCLAPGLVYNIAARPNQKVPA